MPRKVSARTRRAAVPSTTAVAPPAPTPADFEKLGAFFLGRPYDLAAGAPRDGLTLYDSKDLVTHAVCIGMTGSGKTGLCLALIEEAAIDRVPAILIDPKGDLGNLLLTFPNLAPADFRPWIDEEEARRRGVSPDDHAAKEAEKWRHGLASWGQDGERIRRLRDAVDLAIYTPGSTAGIPLSILASFGAPPAAVRDDAELLRERIAVTASSVLGLLGIDADPVRSREHILVSTILGGAWGAGRDLDLGQLIELVQRPGVERIGVLDLEAFYPARERFELAMAINNLLAAPGFSAWREGEPLDVARLLHTPEGKPRVSIVSIAHLSEPERMVVVALLLSQVAAWMRTQSGTSSLRAIVYMDEILGYFPPVANPPAKAPLLTLLKQARAYGVGIVLATQNPVDLDYKGLANAGTWFLGRLQTERDKARVLEGLEGASAGRAFDRDAMEATLAALGSRVFLLHNVHEDAPEIFESRWALSYLRGPLTRAQIQTLMAGRPRPAAAAPAVAPPIATPAAAPTVTAPAPASGEARAAMPPDVPQVFLPVRARRPDGAALVYHPMLLGAASLRYVDAKKTVDALVDTVVVVPLVNEPAAVDWEHAHEAGVAAGDLDDTPADGARYESAPPAATKAKSYDGWRRELASWLAANRPLTLLRSAAGVVSRPGESEGDFRVRVTEASHEARDAVTERLRKKYAPKIAALQERVRRAEQSVARENAEASQTQLQTAISIGATLLGAFLGRKAVSASTIGRATTAARSASRVLKDRQDVARASESVQVLRDQLAALEAEFRAEVDAQDGGSSTETFESVQVRASKTNVTVRLVALAWMPHWQRPGQVPVSAVD
jgi:hypothetical protein